MAAKKPVESSTEKPAEDQTPEQPPQAPEGDQPSTETPTTESSEDTTLFDMTVDAALAGQFGDYYTARARLKALGYDEVAVIKAVNARLGGGAPAAYRPSVIGLLKQVQDGEWGEEKGLAARLRGAGFSKPVVTEVFRNLETS